MDVLELYELQWNISGKMPPLYTAEAMQTALAGIDLGGRVPTMMVKVRLHGGKEREYVSFSEFYRWSKWHPIGRFR